MRSNYHKEVRPRFVCPSPRTLRYASNIDETTDVTILIAGHVHLC